jgi:predicted  nucleic acid-binding Zn-ribbon protein
MAKRVSIDRLAEMVAGGFQELQDEMRHGFQRLNERMDAHDGRFDEVDTRLDRIERKLDSTIERVDDHSVRLGRLEKAKE